MNATILGYQPRWELRAPVTLVTAALALSLTLLLRDAELLHCALDGLKRGELWRLLTGPLIHADLAHALRDLLSLVVLGVLYERRLGWRFSGALLASTVLPPLFVFATDPTTTIYYGLSCTIHGLWAAALAFEWRRARWHPGLLIWLVSVAFVSKLIFELLTATPMLAIAVPTGLKSVPGCHFAGALCGLVVAAVPNIAKDRVDSVCQ
jgi:rhomboid family GlyGly-CTERM serine protease